MLEIIVFTLFLATILNIVFKKLGIPTIIGYIATGTTIAYAFGLHEALHNHDLREIAEFGIVFLMFTIGLEFSLNHLRQMKKEVFFYGLLQVVITAFVFTIIASFAFGIETKSSIIIALALALSSTAIVLKLFNETGEITRTHGRNVFGVLLFQDIAVIPILLMISIFALDSDDVLQLLGGTVISAAILLGSMWVVGKRLLEPFFAWVVDTKSNEIFIGSVLLMVMGASYAAHALGFSYSLGAFMAGMMIAETHYKHQVEADLIPFRDLLLGVFFITVGMQLKFDVIYTHIGTIILLLIAIMIIKLILMYLIFSFTYKPRVVLKTALSLFGLGEFALVIFELARANNLIDPTISQILVITIVFSMIITPFVVKNLDAISDKIFDSLAKDNIEVELSDEINNLEGHTIVIGYGRLGKNIVNHLKTHDMPYIIVEGDNHNVKKAKKEHEPIVFGNATQKNILESVNIEKASSVFISVGNSQKLFLICEAVSSLNSIAKTVVKVNTFEEKEMLRDLNLYSVIVETEATAQTMIDQIVSPIT
ncbi:MAG: cation:proton antiporter [Arcobacteraceae bacterium]|nr:cation:proton antiporter [Arcobacteraceae bacterium]